MSRSNGDWFEEPLPSTIKSPTSPVLDQVKFTFEEDWTIEDEDYSYTYSDYSDEEETAATKTPSPQKQSSYVRQRSLGGRVGTKAPSPNKTLQRQNSKPAQLFIKYCNGKIPAEELVNDIIKRVLANADVARQLALTLGVIVKDEHTRQVPSLLPVLLRNIQQLYTELKTKSNTLQLSRVLGIVALLCACFEHLTSDEGTPLLSPLVGPIIKSLEILLDYNPAVHAAQLIKSQEKCNQALLHHMRLLGAQFERCKPASVDLLFDKIRSTVCCASGDGNSMQGNLALLELIELRASAWKLPQSSFTFYSSQKNTGC